MSEKINNNKLNNYLNQLKEGNNTIYKKDIVETKVFEEKWIETIESYLPSINNIISSPLSTLKRNKELVLVERVRKVDSHSIKHLASNTKYIRKVKDGNVIPNKLQTTHTNVDYFTYENRFIKTLIERLYRFTQKRVEIIKKDIDSKEKTRVNLNSKFNLGNNEVNFDLSMDVSKNLEEKKIKDYNQNLIKRINNLENLIKGMYYSPFMRDLKTAINVKPPINRTIVILKNPDYNNAYLLWTFLDRYDELPFDLNIDISNVTIDQNELETIEKLILDNYFKLLNSNKYQLSEKETLNLKGLRQDVNNPNDLLTNPTYLKMESNLANEYYLKQFTNLFNDNITNHTQDVKLEETALKRSMRDLTSITNNIYSSYFEFNQDRDIFNRLVKEENIFDLFEKEKKKVYYQRLIREVKEIDYNDSVRLERRLINDLLNHNKLLKEAYENEKIITAKNLEEKLLDEHKIKVSKKYYDDLNLLLENVKENREKLRIETNEANEKIRKLERKLKQEQEEYLKEIRDELTKKHNKEIKQLTKEHNIRIERLRQRFVNDEREKDLQLQTRILNLNKEFQHNKGDILKDLNRFFNWKYNEYVNKLNKKMFEAKVLIEDQEIENEFKRRKILSEEIYKNK